ncbi:MAG: heme oxygenase (biliverdin-producing) [Cyanothece sp. SIO2G6]|nr:heme oxygenase (biliverdin-producing) [Cyanothece sp. SIO2G6]
MNFDLAKKLREGTMKAHTMAENVGFVKCFLKGVVEKNSYRKLVSGFYYIYSELEEQMYLHRDHPALGKIYFPLINRRRSLEKDLNFYYGDNWQDLLVASPKTQAYVQRIREISGTQPELLIAHSYTRYMGDLSGGQILKKIAQRALNLSNGQGTSFYEFQDVADAKQFKALYRQRLNEISLDETMVERIVDEANTAFSLNMNLFKEIEGSFIKAIGNVLFNTLTRQRTSGSTEIEAAQ